MLPPGLISFSKTVTSIDCLRRFQAQVSPEITAPKTTAFFMTVISLEMEITSFLTELREKIIESFQNMESYATFERKKWAYQKGSGGGEIALLRGSVFEKAAVNFSAIRGEDF